MIRAVRAGRAEWRVLSVLRLDRTEVRISGDGYGIGGDGASGVAFCVVPVGKLRRFNKRG
jgi:hypothetical protein